MGFSVVIDGYNLIARMWGMGKGGSTLEKQRHDLIRMLGRYRQVRDVPVHVVFDGWKAGEPGGSRTRDHGIDITFSPRGVTADEVIRDLVKEEGAGVLVVTADKRVQGWAGTYGGEWVDSSTFVGKLMEAAAATKLPEGEEAPSGLAAKDDDYGDVWEGSTAKKGNPKKKSKRERKLGGRLKRL